VSGLAVTPVFAFNDERCVASVPCSWFLISCFRMLVCFGSQGVGEAGFPVCAGVSAVSGCAGAAGLFRGV